MPSTEARVRMLGYWEAKHKDVELPMNVFKCICSESHCKVTNVAKQKNRKVTPMKPDSRQCCLSFLSQ